MTSAELYELQGGCCFYCSTHLRPHPWRAGTALQQKGFTRDHVWPQVKGGMVYLNIVLACYRCNNEKANRDPTEDELELCSMLYGGTKLADARRALKEGNGPLS